MKQRRPMRKKRPLRISRCTTGIAKTRGKALVKALPVIGVRFACDQSIKQNRGRTCHVRALGGRKSRYRGVSLGCCARARKHDPVTHPRTVLSNPLNKAQKSTVEKNGLVLGIINHPGQLIGMQPRINRMQNHRCAAHAVVEHQMSIAIPGQCSNTVRGLQAHSGQRIGKSPGLARRLRPGGAIDLAINSPRYHLGVAVMTLRMSDQ